MLSGLTVLELGETVSAAAAGTMLQKLGASVTRVRTTARRSPAPTQRDRVLAALAAGKDEVAVDDPWSEAGLSLAHHADVTIADVAACRSLDRYEADVRRHNRAAWVTISPFGLHGPLRGMRGGELVAVASGGIAYYMRTTADRPMKPAGFGASIAAGNFAALAGLHGTLALRTRDQPIHLDLSMQDAVLVLGVFLELSHVLFDASSEGASKNYSAPSGPIRCSDGLVWVTVLEQHQWEGCVRAAGSPAWAVAITTKEQRYAESDAIRHRLEEWSRGLTAEECADRLQAEGVPATKLNSCTDLLAGVGRDVAADFFVAGPREGELLPGVPVRLTRRRAAARAEEPRRPRLLDATGVLVAPLATSWLGTIGVDVLKVEDPARVDVYRRVGPFLHRTPDPEASAYFAFVNFSKRSYAVRLDEESGRRRFDELVAGADVVVTNFSAHRAQVLGLTAAALDASNGPALVFSSGFGTTTAHAGYRAYGLNIQAASGIVHLSRDRAGVPRNFGTSWADPVTSIWIAAVAMAQILAPKERRCHAEVSMVEVIATQLPEYFSEISLGGTEHPADENRMDHASPHDMYPCAGNEWLALAVETDDEWRRLVDALGAPAELADPRFARLDDRVAAADELDAALERVLAGRSRDHLFELLRQADVACAPVWGARDLVALEHLRERGTLQTVQHPVWGRRALAGVPWRVAGEGALPITVTPLLGEQTSDDPTAWWL